jgi:hypothetical protein
MIITDDYVEIEDFLPVDVQEKLIAYLTSPKFPWAITLDSVDGGSVGWKKDQVASMQIRDDAATGFYHTFLYQGEVCSDHANAVGWIMNGFEQATNGRILIQDLHRIRAGLFTKHPDPTPHKPHVDSPFEDYWSAVYYVNDCDGDLLMYDQTYPEVKLEDVATTNFTVKRICKPAQGKLVAFHGKYYHSSSFPTKKPLRLAITFNFFQRKLA